MAVVLSCCRAVVLSCCAGWLCEACCGCCAQMSHWGFKTADPISRASSPLALGRMRFDECLTPALLRQLSPAQRTVLRIGQAFSMDPDFEAERQRESGIWWGTLEETFEELAASARL